MSPDLSNTVMFAVLLVLVVSVAVAKPPFIPTAARFGNWCLRHRRRQRTVLGGARVAGPVPAISSERMCLDREWDEIVVAWTALFTAPPKHRHERETLTQERIDACKHCLAGIAGHQLPEEA